MIGRVLLNCVDSYTPFDLLCLPVILPVIIAGTGIVNRQI